MDAFEDEDAYNQAFDARERNHQLFDIAPPESERFGSFTVVCLVLNRTIGSGIFLTPSRVLRGTGSVGASLLLWAFGALYGFAGLDCWLQFGLSVPYHLIPEIEQQRNVPRSGGEKNYIEYVFSKFRLLPTCMYGIPFILLGNLSGNAVAFGKQVMLAAGHSADIDQHRGTITGLAISVLALCASLHIFSRRGGIFLSNAFAVLKILILTTIIILGFIKGGGGLSSPHRPDGRHNFDTDQSFKSNNSTDVASFVYSLFFICYSYSGFEQPFYVLSEVARPREIFPKATNTAMGIATTLFLLTNIAYFYAIPKALILDSNLDMATLFFKNVFGNDKAERAMAAIVAISIFGNILVMTYTAARVKQEIGKEGILLFSRIFATGKATPWDWLKRQLRFRSAARNDNSQETEYTPMAALGLHFLSSIFLVGITAALKTDTAYNVLVSLYSYVLVSLIGLVVSGGLIYLTFFKRAEWDRIRDYKSWLGPIPMLFYFISSGFFLVTAFVKPADGSPFSQAKTGLPWYIVPTIGLSSLTWGIIWYGGFKLYSRIVNQTMVKERKPFCIPVDETKPEGRYIQRSERMDIRWVTRVRSSQSSYREDERELASLHSSNAA